MSLSDRGRALVTRIDHASCLPLVARAALAESLVREAVDLIVELAARVQEHTDALIDLRSKLFSLTERQNNDR